MPPAASSYIQKIRNIGIAAHIDAGKTTVTERVLYYAGLLHRMGNVDDGNTVTDFLPEERERGITIVSAAVTVHWRDCEINIIDTPGHVDFTAEVERAMRVLDGAVIVFCGLGGVEAQSETVWRQADRYGIPRLCFINKQDRQGADYDRVVREIESRFGATALPLVFPVNAGSLEFDRVVDLVGMKVLRFVPESLGKVVEEGPVPDEFLDEATARREMLLESIASNDDEFAEFYIIHDDDYAELYIEKPEIVEEQTLAAIRRVTLARDGFPVLCGSALHNVGVQPLLDAVVDFLPSPRDVRETIGKVPGTEDIAGRKHYLDQPLSALAFKNVADPHGELVFVRVYSGELVVRKRFLNATRDRKERAGRIYRMFADRREEAKRARAGDIVALVGLRFTITGDTLTDEEHPIVYEEVVFPEPVVSMAVEPRTNADREKLSDALGKLARQDPTLHFKESEETGELVVSGMGELHLEIVKEFLERDYRVEARFSKPRVTYRETPVEAAAGEGVVDQKIGEKAIYAAVRVRLEPTEENRNRLRPVWNLGSPAPLLPQEIVEAVEEGITAAAGTGPLMGEPIVGAVAHIENVEYEAAKSQPGAFSAAAARAVEDAASRGSPRPEWVLLEPVMKIEVLTPEEYLGNIVTDLGVRQAQVARTDVRGELRVIEAYAALEDMFGYAGTLRSLSSGRAGCTMEPHDYRPVPQERLKRLLAL